MKYGKTKKYRKVARKSIRKKVKRTNFKKYGTTRSRAINGPMAMRQIVKLRYSEDITLTAGSLLGVYDFRANSIYDPNSTGTGHQPLGHDQWGNFYDHYVVLGAKIKVTFNNYNPLATDSCFVSLALQDTSNTMTSQSMIREQPRSSWGMLTTQDGGRAIKTLSKTFSAKKFFGAKSVITWDKLGATFGSNPSEDALFRIFYQNSTGTANLSVMANVVIDYICLFSEPRVLVQS